LLEQNARNCQRRCPETGNGNMQKPNKITSRPAILLATDVLRQLHTRWLCYNVVTEIWTNRGC